MDDTEDTRRRIKRAAEMARGGPVTFAEAIPIVETFRGQVVWEGVVIEFESKNGRVWAWAVQGEKEPQFIAVIHSPSIDSPLAAVRAWLVSAAKNSRTCPHEFVFFDNFPGFEIFECEKCKVQKFVNLETGEATFEQPES